MRVRFNGFTFDSGTRDVRRGDDPIHLSSKAFDLLEALISRRPDVVTQKELYDLLWPDTFVEMANLHNLISEIRNALGDGRRQIIRTAYGIGFSFAAESVDATLARPALSNWYLVVGKERFPLPFGDSVIGRSTDASVLLARRTISRRHARLTITPSSASLEDLGSKNGTFVNRERISSAVAVTPDDDIRLGNVHVRLVRDETTETESAERSTAG